MSVFNNYKWRGPRLVYEYCVLAQTRKLEYSRANADDFDLDPINLRYALQHLTRMSSETATVIFSGQLTEFQIAEDSLPGGLPKAAAILNAMAEILLFLFIPWETLF